jgi:hypothetical protein
MYSTVSLTSPANKAVILKFSRQSLIRWGGDVIDIFTQVS